MGGDDKGPESDQGDARRVVGDFESGEKVDLRGWGGVGVGDGADGVAMTLQ